jgi:hypothetical protein
LSEEIVEEGIQALAECEESGTSSAYLVEEVFRAMIKALSSAHTGGVCLVVCRDKKHKFRD